MSKLLFAAMRKAVPLSKEEETSLISAIQETGCENAKNKLIIANLRFVVSRAKKNLNRGLNLDELISSGSVGLIRAIESFDSTKGFKFLTYAVWWIDEAISKAIEENQIVSVPANKKKLIRKFKEALAKNGGDHDKTIAMVEFAEYKHEIHDLMGKTEVASLDAPINTDDGSVTLGDKMINVNETVDEKDTVEFKVREVFNDYLSKILDKREFTIIKLSHGIGCAALTNEQIGKEVDLSGERVRQIKLKTYGKILKDTTARKTLYQLMKKD